MSLMNTREKFGFLTKLLHWTIFILFSLQFYLVYRREYFPKGSEEKTQYLLLHKSFGFCLLWLALIMIVLALISKRPPFPKNMSKMEVILGKMTHIILYLTMLIMPISGIAMSMLSGYSISVFGWFTLPQFLSKNSTLGDLFFNTHVWCSYIIIAFVSLHIIGALVHHFVRKDNVLKRMMFG